MERDHILPKCRGGENSAENYQLLCVDCHTLKHEIEEGFNILDQYGYNNPARQEVVGKQRHFFGLIPKQPKA